MHLDAHPTKVDRQILDGNDGKLFRIMDDAVKLLEETSVEITDAKNRLGLSKAIFQRTPSIVICKT